MSAGCHIAVHCHTSAGYHKLAAGHIAGRRIAGYHTPAVARRHELAD
jgi:hypothetical protein